MFAQVGEQAAIAKAAPHEQSGKDCPFAHSHVVLLTFEVVRIIISSTYIVSDMVAQEIVAPAVVAESTSTSDCPKVARVVPAHFYVCHVCRASSCRSVPSLVRCRSASLRRRPLSL